MTLISKTIAIGFCAALCCAASTVYVGATFGLYKSTDSGASWNLINIPLNSALLAEPVVRYAIALDPHDPNKIYIVGHAKANVFVSSLDGGQTWTATPLVGMGIGGSVQVDFSGQVIYINAEPATGGGELLYRSTDGGANWNQLTIPLLPGTNPVPYPNGNTLGYFAADKTVAGTVYVEAEGDQFFKSTDYGDTWTYVATQVKVNGTAVAQGLVQEILQDPHVVIPAHRFSSGRIGAKFYSIRYLV